MPKISVLMPIYNTNLKHLKVAISSILSQTFQDFEFLILNDSPENTELDRIVERFSDSRIKYIKSASNLGIAEAHNVLLKKAQGKYIALMDHDDISLPKRLEQQYNYMENHKEVGICGTAYKKFGKWSKYKKVYHPIEHKDIEALLLFNCPIFAYHVSDPERFGVVEFDENHNAISIEEKPKQPKSNYASVGLYFYPSDVVEKARNLKPSARGELEITDLNNLYLQEKRMSIVPMRRGNAWLDAGTPESLMESGAFVQIMEKRQGLKIACIEEIAYRRGFINAEQMLSLISQLKDGTYKTYLQKVYNDYD